MKNVCMIAPKAKIDIGFFFFTPPCSNYHLIFFFLQKCAYPPKSAHLFGFYSTVRYTAAAVVHTIDRHD